jgi:hypothetical protein
MTTPNNSLRAAVKALKIAVLRLPPERAAKVADVVSRLELAGANGADETKVAALVQALQRALDEEPWIHLNGIVQRLGQEIRNSSSQTK